MALEDAIKVLFLLTILYLDIMANYSISLKRWNQIIYYKYNNK